VIVSFKKPAEGQIGVPEAPSQNPTDKGENRQSIKNEGNHKFLSICARRPAPGFAGGRALCRLDGLFHVTHIQTLPARQLFPGNKTIFRE
jgi:hypothetical protein